MKLILFTPVIKSSAIARMACLVGRKLIENGYNLTVVRTENSSCYGEPIHPFGLNIVAWSDFDEIYHLTKTADVLIYQIGNHYPFHEGGVFWLSKLSGIVCLHDFYLTHLFKGWAQNNLAQAQLILKTWYGEKITREFFSFKNRESFIEWSYQNAPMTEWLCSMAEAIITHSSWHVERILNSCPGSVSSVPLPYESLLGEATSSSPLKKNNEFYVLTIGHMNTNKRVKSVIQAIGKNRFLRKKITYNLVGHITEEMKINLLTFAKKLKVKILISGEVNDVELIKAIDKADLISCLRWPALETASASAIEAMLSAKPILVTNTGFYQEIPDKCAIKIDPKNEIKELTFTLEKLVNKPDDLKNIALKGYSWSKKNFMLDNYVSKLINIFSSSEKNKVILDAFQFFAKQIHHWGVDLDLIGKDTLIESLSFFE